MYATIEVKLSKRQLYLAFTYLHCVKALVIQKSFSIYWYNDSLFQLNSDRRSVDLELVNGLPKKGKSLSSTERRERVPQPTSTFQRYPSIPKILL